MAFKNSGRSKIQAEISKIEAETKKLNQEIELAAETARINLAKIQAESLKAEADARVVNAGALAAEIINRQNLRAEEELLASNKFHNTYHFTKVIDEVSVKECMDQVDIWRRSSNFNRNIELIFTSPGGLIFSGLVLFDYLNMLKSESITVTTGTYGMAASMAGILLQAGSKRWMGKEAWILIHEGSLGVWGTSGQVEDTLGWMKRFQERALDIFASRSGKDFKATKALIRRNWNRKDWWLSSDECLKYGFVDEVR